MSHPSSTGPEPKAIEPGASEDFETLLVYLKHSRGFDFTAYKRSGLMRRVLVRMQTVGVTTFAEYQDFLQVDPEEFTRLFNTILINVTTFFRDAPAWDYLAQQIIPELLERIPGSLPIRVWSAGCASGEEAYTIAMIIAEAIGPEAFQERVKIYATDVDEEALGEARQAVYSDRDVEDVPRHLLDKYFERTEGGYTFNKDLRRSVIFGRHDLIQDAPISRVHLLACRNCLMYFNAETQSRILARFHFALAEGGILFLGKAETLLSHSALFDPVDVKRRLFSKAPRDAALPPSPDRHAAAGQADDRTQLRTLGADAVPLATVLLDGDGLVVQVNQEARRLFGLTQRDVGRRLQDLEISYRPFELRSCIDRAFAERRPVTMGSAEWKAPTGEAVTLELSVAPVFDADSAFAGAVVSYSDVTRLTRLQDEIRRTGQELETALEELQSTNEELETTNEELQSTIEELETTNEELQSTNEELETMNEELQSTNEELQTINEEARERGDELSELNLFLEGVLTSLRGAVVVVDSDFRVHKWSRKAEELWGLRSDEVLNRNFLNLDIGLPVDQLKAPMRACLSGEAEHVNLVLDATNRRGKPVQVTVTCSPLTLTHGASSTGVIMIMEQPDV